MKNKDGNAYLKKLTSHLKLNLIILVCVTLAFCVFGVIYAFAKKPVYTVTERVVYQAKILESKDSPHDYTATKEYFDTACQFYSSGVVIERANYYYEEYLSNKDKYATVDEYIDFVKETSTSSYEYKDVNSASDAIKDKQVVIEARMYMGDGEGFKEQREKFIGVFKGFERKPEKNGEGNLVDGVLAEVIKLEHVIDGREINLRTNRFFVDGATQAVDFYTLKTQKPSSYTTTKNYSFIDDMLFIDDIKEVSSDANYITESNLTINSNADKGKMSFAIEVNYTDNSEIVAQEKARIIILAADIESKVCAPFANEGRSVKDYMSGYKYFGVRISFSDWGTLYATPSFRKSSVIIKSTALGLVLGVASVLVKGLIECYIDGRKKNEEGAE